MKYHHYSYPDDGYSLVRKTSKYNFQCYRFSEYQLFCILSNYSVVPVIKNLTVYVCNSNFYCYALEVLQRLKNIIHLYSIALRCIIM